MSLNSIRNPRFPAHSLPNCRSRLCGLSDLKMPMRYSHYLGRLPATRVVVHVVTTVPKKQRLIISTVTRKYSLVYVTALLKNVTSHKLVKYFLVA